MMNHDYIMTDKDGLIKEITCNINNVILNAFRGKYLYKVIAKTTLSRTAVLEFIDRYVKYDVIEIVEKYDMHKDFQKWFDKESVNYRLCSESLVQYFSKQFDIWWDAERFNWWDASWWLPVMCKDKFKIWWNPEQFSPDSIEALYLYCKEYADIWHNDLMRTIRIREDKQ